MFQFDFRFIFCFVVSTDVNQSKALTVRRSVRCLGGVAESGNAAQAVTEEDLLKWVKNDNRRMLHVVYRVGDLDRTIKYNLFFSFSTVKCPKEIIKLKAISNCWQILYGMSWDEASTQA